MTAATTTEKADGWEGYSLLLGTDYVIGSHKLIGGVQYYDGELSGNSDYNFRRTVFRLLMSTNWRRRSGSILRRHIPWAAGS